jgi:hypothetical protein
MIKAAFDTRELAEAIQAASVTVVKPRKAPKAKMVTKKTKTFQAGTSGASMGYPKSDLLSKFTGHKCIGHF